MKTTASKKYAFHFLKNFFDFLSFGMGEIKSNCLLQWDENRKELKVINKSDNSSLEIHLKNISGRIGKKPDFNMCVFPHKCREGGGRVNLDRLKFVPSHLKPRWEAHKVPDGFFDEIIVCGGIGTRPNTRTKCRYRQL